MVGKESHRGALHSADHREDEKYSSRLKIFFSIGA